MRTILRKVGNSRGVLIPAALLAECHIDGAVDMTVEAGRLIIVPAVSPREGWFDGYDPSADKDVWAGLPVDDGVEEEWAW